MTQEKEKPKIAFCPNCQQPATRLGNVITCDTCDAEFTITKSDGAKVKSQGRLDSLEDRVGRIEDLLPDDDPEPSPDPEPKPEIEDLEKETGEDEDDIL